MTLSIGIRQNSSSCLRSELSFYWKVWHLAYALAEYLYFDPPTDLSCICLLYLPNSRVMHTDLDGVVSFLLVEASNIGRTPRGQATYDPWLLEAKFRL